LVLGAIAALYRHDENGGAIDAFFSASILAVNLTALLAAVYGGLAIAGERIDRTSDFIVLLPATRKQIIASKWIVSAATLGVAAGVHIVFACLLLYPKHAMSPFERMIWQWMLPATLWFGCLCSFYGVGWLLGSFINSAVISACASVAVTLALCMIMASLPDYLRGHDKWQIILAAMLLTIGGAGIFTGTIHYLRRVAP
jgi:ABC-type transport system involved in multi-copper enzyme maturation permease subunit